MNKETADNKDSILKILAIAGFIGIIIFIAWASIQLVSVVPGAFGSLASLAESVNNPSKTTQNQNVDSIIVTSNTMLAQSGEIVNLNWETVRANGSYVFSFNCVDGVAIDLITDAGIKSIQCGNNYNIGNTDSAAISIESEKNRYADITYSISFLGTNDIRPRAAGTATITVLNNQISSIVDEENNTSEQEDDSATAETPTEQPSTPTTPTVPSTPRYVQEYTYAIPTSDPNGKTDLSTRYLFLGEIVNNKFVAGAVKRDRAGAVQFEVKNLGTKTSKSWTFTIALPGGKTYKSKTQRALKPNERAVLTVGFTGADVASHNFKVTVDVASDSNRTNNKFSHRVNFF